MAKPAPAGGVRQPFAWMRVGGLGVVTIVAYGVAYYSYGALIDPIKAGTGWSSTALGATFSAVLVIGGAGGLAGGRLVDRFGTRPAFLIAGTVGAGAIAAASLPASLPAFAALYAVGAGVISALGFYHITQPTAIRSAPGEPERAVVWLTILGAFSSPIFLPLTAWLVHELGWRGALRIQGLLAAVVFLVCAIQPTPKIQGAGDRSSQPTAVRRALAEAWRLPAVRRWILASIISGVAVDVILVYQVPVLVAAGLSTGIAATIGGLRGFMQLAGRLPLSPLLARIGARRCLIVALLAGFAGTLLLLIAAITFTVLAGASIGALYTLQGIYTNELVGGRNLSLLMGAQQAVFAIGGAFGPIIAGAIFGADNSYTPVVLLTAGGFLAATAILATTRSPDRRTPVHDFRTFE